MDNKDIVSTLNDLIEANCDGEKDYKTCAEDAGSRTPELRTLLAARQQEYGVAATELKQLVRAHGGDPVEHSTASGAIHRAWIDIKTAITDDDDQTILNECEHREDATLKSYRKAIEQELPPEVRVTIERQYENAKRGHSQIKALRNQARAIS
ncbi:MAG: PA2169 family four-helix-bundle protein [Herbaspirillum sp.]